MTNRLNVLAFVLVILLAAPVFAADKVIISYRSRSYAFLPAQIAVAKGFFKDENLEPLQKTRARMVRRSGALE